MENRHVLSYVLFIIGVILIFLVGAMTSEWLVGLLLGLACFIVGVVFYRRGK